VDYVDRFVGHCNTTTDIKEANFYGKWVTCDLPIFSYIFTAYLSCIRSREILVDQIWCIDYGFEDKEKNRLTLSENPDHHSQKTNL
jgi:hypothetical protein